MQRPPSQPLARLLAALAWLTLLLQFFLYLPSPTPIGLALALIKFVQFFTVLTNLFVALIFSAHAFTNPPLLLRPFQSPALALAAATYILIVAVVFEILIHPYYHPTGIDLLSSVFLHNLLPLAYLAFWYHYIPASKLSRRAAPLFLLYPLAFAIWNALLSRVAHHNPYPFLDISFLGFQRFFLVVPSLLLTFYLLALLFLTLDNKRRAPIPSAP